MTADRTHALLPWYATGTLDTEETKTFEKHLESCDPCREELEKVTAMRIEIARHGEAFFGEHPAPELLGALFGLGEASVDPAQGEQIRRHLAVCASCSEETRWLTGVETAGGWMAQSTAGVPSRAEPVRAERPIPQPRESALERTPSLLSRLWPVAAAACLTMLVTVFLPGPWRHAAPSGPVARGFLDSAHRASTIPEVLVRPEDVAIVLDLVSELTAAQVPARVEILDATGRIVRHVEDLRPATGGTVTILVPRADLPPGAYAARLLAHDPSEPPTEFPFRIVAETP